MGQVSVSVVVGIGGKVSYHYDNVNDCHYDIEDSGKDGFDATSNSRNDRSLDI